MKPNDRSIEAIRDFEHTADKMLAEIAASAEPVSQETIEGLKRLADAAAEDASGAGGPDLLSRQMHNLIAWTDLLNDPEWASRFQKALKKRPLVGPFGVDHREEPMPKASSRTKIKILAGLVAIFLFSIVMGLISSPMSGITNFFILTILLWALAKTSHWI